MGSMRVCGMGTSGKDGSCDLLVHFRADTSFPNGIVSLHGWFPTSDGKGRKGAERALRLQLALQRLGVVFCRWSLLRVEVMRGGGRSLARLARSRTD